MIPDHYLLWAAWVEGLLLSLGWLFLIGSGFRSALRRRRERRIRAVRDLLTKSLLNPSSGEEARAELRGMSHARQREVFLLVAPSLRGRERKALTGTAQEIGLVDHGRRLCSSPLWWRRLHGARLLTLVGGGEDRVLPLAADPHPLVRAQAATWCGANPSDTAVATLLGMLGDPSLGSRFAVQDALVRLGGRMREPLAEELRRVREPVEARTALTVARAVGDSRLSPAIRTLVQHDAPEVRAAAYGALGRSGGPDAPQLLEVGLEDPSPDVRAAAALALGEVGHWQSGRHLVRLLEDPSWDVRHAAGRALVQLGPPGELLLRRAREAEDPFAADMARYAMEVAAVQQGAG